MELRLCGVLNSNSFKQIASYDVTIPSHSFKFSLVGVVRATGELLFDINISSVDFADPDIVRDTLRSQV